MEQINSYLEIATHIAAIFGIPAAIFMYLREQKLQRAEREYGTYDALDDKYIELQQLCLQYPELDVFDTPKESTTSLREEQKKSRRGYFTYKNFNI